jgi:predicted NACHT family NTPase
MVFGLTAAGAAAWLGEWVTVTIAGAVLGNLQSHLKPDEMQRVLQQATNAANQVAEQLFYACPPDGRQGVQAFLQNFFQTQEVKAELQKPLQDQGKPDVAVLVAVFERDATEHQKMNRYKPEFLQAWMVAFVDSYFDQIKGICFRVKKQEYLRQLAHRVDDIKFVGIAVPGDEVEKQGELAQIFVMPDVREERGQSADQAILDFGLFGDGEESATTRQRSLLEEQRRWAMRDRSGRSLPAQQVLKQSKNKAVLLGAPGSGKTTLISYFALMLSEQTQSDPAQIGFDSQADCLPLVIRIRDWILQPNQSILAYLRCYAEESLAVKKLPLDFFEYWLDQGRALILLDGLDEVVDEAQRRKVVEQIETFLKKYEENPAIITSRPAGYRWDFFNLETFPHYTLEPFDNRKTDQFIDHWYSSRISDKARAERSKADLRKALKGSDRIQKLAKNPLLLTIIALIHRYQAELPVTSFTRWR